MISSLWTAFKALSWFSKGAGLVSFIPGAGPVLGFLFALVQAAWLLIKTCLKGATRILQRPDEMITVGLALIFFFCLGLHWGAKWDAHLVAEARSKLATFAGTVENENAKDRARAEAAALAAAEAERLERQRIAAEAQEVGRDPPSPKMAPLALVDPAAVAGAVPAPGVRNHKSTSAKNSGRKPEPGMFDGLYKAVTKAVSPSKW